jgi:Glutamyl-tRNA reductase
MPLIAIGVNHRATPVEIRERLSVSASSLPETLQSIRSFGGVDGAAVLSTCNRVEAILSAESEDVIEPMVQWFTERASAERSELEKHVYVLRHGDVVKHLFRVASGSTR